MQILENIEKITSIIEQYETLRMAGILTEAAIDDIFNTAQMKPFLRKNSEILYQMNDICQQFEPSETEKLNLEDFTRLTFKALQPFIEYYLGIEETTYQQIITDNSNPLTQSIEQMVTMVFKEATNIEPK